MADNSETIGERIKKFRKTCSGFSTQQGFAQAINIDQQRLSGYENGTRVPHHVVAAIIRLGANAQWLLFGEGDMRGRNVSAEGYRDLSLKVVSHTAVSFTERQLAEFYVLPLYADEVAAGQPLEVRDTEIEGPAIIHRAWCPNPSQTDYVRVHATGRSMEPTIPAGAIVTIDRSEVDPERLLGKIVAIGRRESGVTLKRLRRTERGGYVGLPDNPSLDHHAVHLEEGDRIIGLVRTVHACLV